MWILHLAPFKFKDNHTRGADVVADSSQMFEGHKKTDQEEGLLAMIQGLLLVYNSVEEDRMCKDLVEALEKGDPTAAKFQLHNSLLCYQLKGDKTR
jgi:hypothetical protein